MLRLIAVGVLVVGLVGGTSAQEKKPEGNKEKLLGTWEIIKADEGTAPVGTTVEFTKDGKVKVTPKGEQETREHLYKIDGDKIIIEEGPTVTIKKVTDSELHVIDPEGKMVELKRKKK